MQLISLNNSAILISFKRSDRKNTEERLRSITFFNEHVYLYIYIVGLFRRHLRPIVVCLHLLSLFGYGWTLASPRLSSCDILARLVDLQEVLDKVKA